MRSIHLQGGCRANDVNGSLQLQPIASNRKIASLSAPDYASAYAILQAAGYQILGVDFYTSVEQADGRRLPDWRAYHHIGSTSWPCAEQADEWSFLAHGALRQNNGILWDVASRIRHQFRTCDWRLRQVSDCYRDQLNALVRANSFVNGHRIEDGFTWLGYLAIQSFLVDACVLRDYLAEYRALLLTQARQYEFKGKITRIGSLKKQYLNQISSRIAVDQTLFTASEPGGWLHLLGTYRDLVVHFAPLASAGNDLYAVCSSLQLNSEASLPMIKLPLPPDPATISENRTSGAYWDDPEQNYARFLNALEDPSSAKDGLQYAHSSLGHLALLASELIAISPIKPEMRVLTERDILDIHVIRGAPDSSAD